jgi:hypothetical protein
VAGGRVPTRMRLSDVNRKLNHMARFWVADGDTHLLLWSQQYAICLSPSLSEEHTISVEEDM